MDMLQGLSHAGGGHIDIDAAHWHHAAFLVSPQTFLLFFY